MKWFSWFMKVTITALFFTMISVYATWTAVHTYLDRLLAHYNLGTSMQKIEFSDFLAEFGSGLNIMNGATSPTNTQSGTGIGVSGQTFPAGAADEGRGKGESGVSAGDSGVDPASDSGGQSSGSAGGYGRPEDEGAGVTEEPDAVAVFGHSGGSSVGQQIAGAEQQKMMILSTESLQSTKDMISGDDKMKLFTLLVAKLPPEDLQTLSLLMEDGITQEELVQMDAIVQKHLTKEEYGQLVAILEKYQ